MSYRRRIVATLSNQVRVMLSCGHEGWAPIGAKRASCRACKRKGDANAASCAVCHQPPGYLVHTGVNREHDFVSKTQPQEGTQP